MVAVVVLSAVAEPVADAAAAAVVASDAVVSKREKALLTEQEGSVRSDP